MSNSSKKNNFLPENLDRRHHRIGADKSDNGVKYFQYCCRLYQLDKIAEFNI